jgi:hypothetical protein
MAKIRKELKSIESTGICEAMKEVLAKAPKTNNVDPEKILITFQLF